MKRLIDYHLQTWKEDARQVGKTFVVRHLGKSFNSVVEVKSGHGTTLRSMHQFLADHSHTPCGVRFWANQPSHMEKLDSLPLYAAVLFAHTDQVQALQKLI